MRAPTLSSRTIRFGPFIANLRSGELHKGPTKLKLQEQPFKILAVLLAQAGEVVTRDDLRKRLWPDDTYIDFDHGINMAIGKIREALGDSAEEPQFVETLGRRGYRFIAAVEPASDEITSAVAHERVLQSDRHSVGREKERAELAVAFESVTEGCGALVCVAGEPGIGKNDIGARLSF